MPFISTIGLYLILFSTYPVCLPGFSLCGLLTTGQISTPKTSYPSAYRYFGYQWMHVVSWLVSSHLEFYTWEVWRARLAGGMPSRIWFFVNGSSITWARWLFLVESALFIFLRHSLTWCLEALSPWLWAFSLSFKCHLLLRRRKLGSARRAGSLKEKKLSPSIAYFEMTRLRYVCINPHLSVLI